MSKIHYLQWHITQQCNLRCNHCYQEDYSKESYVYEFKNILIQYKTFIQEKGYEGQINVTGGEPFMYSKIFEFLNLIKDIGGIKFSILTNGTMINDEIAEKLKELDPVFVQVSIDGDKKTHDEIRGVGNFEKAVRGLKILKKYNMKTMISFTAQKNNYKQFKEVVKTAKMVGAYKVWSDRVIPFGDNGKTKLMMNTHETMDFFIVLKKEYYKYRLNMFNKTKVDACRALQFIPFREGQVKPYQCSAGKNLLTILANGDIVPCRRLPIIFGNVLKNTISELYDNSEVIKKLNSYNIPEGCEKCLKLLECRGGSKCLTYAVTGKLFCKDINCPYE